MENRKFLTKGRIIIGLVLLFLFLPFLLSFVVGISSLSNGKQWIYYYSDSRTGRVVDAETNQPIEGAVVVADWSTWSMGREPHPLMIILFINPLYYMGDNLAHTFGSEKIVVAATDKDGRYEIPSWWSFRPWAYSQIGSEDPHMCIYKPGYKTLYTDLGRWIMNGKEISVDINYLPLAKSLMAKEIEADFEKFCLHGFDNIEKKERLKIAGFIENNLKDIPVEYAKKIKGYLCTD